MQCYPERKSPYNGKEMKNQKEFCFCSEKKEGFKYKENNLAEAEQPE